MMGCMPNITLPNPTDQPLLPVWPDAAKALGLSRTTAYRLAESDDLPIKTLRVGGRLRVRTADLISFLGLEPVSS